MDPDVRNFEIDEHGRMLVDFDCERIVAGFLGQPVNTLTTLALFAAGAVIMRLPSMRWVGIALIATGVGSFIFHGPMPGWGEWVHDVTLAWLLLVVAGRGRRWQKWSLLPGLAVVTVLLAVFPVLGDPLGAVLAVAAVAGLLASDRTMRTIGPLLLLSGVAILGRVGATGGPLCQPDSLWQWHGLWHVGAATVVAWWALAQGKSKDPGLITRVPTEYSESDLDGARPEEGDGVASHVGEERDDLFGPVE